MQVGPPGWVTVSVQVPVSEEAKISTMALPASSAMDWRLSPQFSARCRIMVSWSEHCAPWACATPAILIT